MRLKATFYSTLKTPLSKLYYMVHKLVFLLQQNRKKQKIKNILNSKYEAYD